MRARTELRGISATAYRALLHLLPPSLRREYRDLMLDAFIVLGRDRRGGPGSALRFWQLVVGDFLETFGREWGTELRMTNWRQQLLRLMGLAGIAGAAGWFVLFIGPEWEPLGRFGWDQNGLGYRPRALTASSVLLALGLIGIILHEGGGWSRLRLSGMWLLVVSAGLIAAQAPVPMGGVSFTATPAVGTGVYLLPLSVAVLAVDWSRGPTTRPAETALRRSLAIAVSVVAVGLVLPLDGRWYDTWDFVVRSAFIFPALAIALVPGYSLLGGPRLEVRLVRPTHPEVA